MQITAARLNQNSGSISRVLTWILVRLGLDWFVNYRLFVNCDAKNLKNAALFKVFATWLFMIMDPWFFYDHGCIWWSNDNDDDNENDDHGTDILSLQYIQLRRLEKSQKMQNSGISCFCIFWLFSNLLSWMYCNDKISVPNHHSHYHHHMAMYSHIRWWYDDDMIWWQDDKVTSDNKVPWS